MTPTELHELLSSHDARPIKARGQHFLLDESVVQKMTDAAEVQVGDVVLEIGPGPGILTAELLKWGAEVTAVELDLKMGEILKTRFGEQKNFHLLSGDVLKKSNLSLRDAGSLSLRAVPGARRGNPAAVEPYKVVANLPYNITSKILQKFLLEDPKPQSLTIMIQKEVADRILAEPGDMSSLAVMVQTYGEPSRVVEVPPGAFYPPPQVKSTVIKIKVKSQKELETFFGQVRPERFFGLVQQAFAAPRKQLKTSLKSFSPEKALDQAKISPMARPEELSVIDWLSLTKNVSDQT